MAKLKKRILSLILCVVMVFGITPNMTVNAQQMRMKERNEMEQEEKNVRVVKSIEDGVVFYKNEVEENGCIKRPTEDMSASPFSLTKQDEDYFIENFEDLKMVQPEEDCAVFYEGEDPLEITEDYVMPEEISLYMNEKDLKVSEDVTFTVEGSIMDVRKAEVKGAMNVEDSLRCDTLVVDGTMYAELIEVREQLAVNGQLYCTDILNIKADTEIINRENIILEGNASIYAEVYVESWDEILDCFEIAKKTENEQIIYEICIEEDLIITISESMTIPENVTLDLWGSAIKILKDAEVIYNSGFLSAGKLDVEGTLIAEDLYVADVSVAGNLKVSYLSVEDLTVTGSAEVRDLYAGESVTVSGSLYIDERWTIENDEENPFKVTGNDKIQYGPEAYIDRTEFVKTFAELKKLVIEAGNAVVRTECEIYIDCGEEQEFVIDESLVIPDYILLNSFYDSAVKIEKDCTLTIYGKVEFQGKLTVDGILENYGKVYAGEEILVFSNPDAYRGGGYLIVYKNDKFESWQDAISGLNLSNFEVVKQSDGRWELRNVAGLIKLGTPTEVTWGYNRLYVWNDKLQEEEYKEVKFPGGMKIVTADPWQSQLQIDFYCVEDGKEEQIGDAHWRFGSDEEAGDPLYLESFCMENPESGTYFFEVTQKADYIKYCDGDTVRSGYYTYVKPDKKVGTCTNLQWNGLSAEYEAPEKLENVGGYEVQWFYAENLYDEPEQQGGGWTYDTNGILRATLHDEIIQERGSGYYYFRVRALSRNIEVACNGEWSELSPAYFMTDVVKNVNGELNDIMDDAFGGNLSQQDVLDAVQSMDTEELRESMLADQEIVRKIAELENFVGGQAPVNVAKDASDFDPNQISIIGANLNKNISEEPISLIIDKPEKNNVIPELYDSSVAVKFSMTLENVEDAKNLEVPVEITLPVPATINPAFLVVLHYHADESVEELRPYVHEENGQYYATFVLTSFSDFALTEKVNSVERIFGTTRYETGYKVADQLKEVLGVEKFEAVVVATGKNFADALAGSYLAIRKNAPILLTNGKSDNIEMLHDYINANVQKGGFVYILGGEGAVPAEAAAIDGYDVVRLAGKSRYETNLAILEAAGIHTDEIIISTGKSFADSLSASAVGLPILLVKPGESLNDAQKEILNDMNVCGIVGGTSAVSAEVEEELKEFGEVIRISGKTRYETSVALAETVFGDIQEVVVASGKNFPDGLCGGPLAAAMGVPLILTADGKTDAAAGYMSENKIATGFVLGGTGALSDKSVIHIFAK